MTAPSEVGIDTILPSVFVVRGVKAMLDSDLAVLYGVSTKRLNERVKRNGKRFPDDFMFQLSQDEFKIEVEVAICDHRLGRPSNATVRLYRAWHCDAIECANQ